MSSTASASGDVLPALPPVRTAESARSSSTAPDAESRPSSAAEKREEEEEEGEAGSQEEAEPATPTSEESRLQPPTDCPPAPRKPAWALPPPTTTTMTPAKRKFPSARRTFFPVARDLSTVFRALPPKKRIRGA